MLDGEIDGSREVLLTKDAQPFLISGSGTLGWDQVSANLVESGDDVLVLHSGYFGGGFAAWYAFCFVAPYRYSQVQLRASLKAYGANVTQVNAPVGAAVNPSQLEGALRQKQYKLVTITHVDTSTGVLSNVKALTEVVRRVSPQTLVCASSPFFCRPNAEIMSARQVAVDAVCSVASEELKMDEWGVDVVLSASQKGLGAPPGLSILAASQRALAVYRARNTPVASYYVSWDK